ncbi:hypothetical protein SAY86_030123 [Trapa natans]|uniref:Enoyl reductase (ER) domain-containing protein n=1 Tax=Trapa natans TaxID=22666 RepID=A0AAN7MFJ6_TRANT|nr:hypothetical protein SAY86_030123 [Trapa natans]
MGDYSSSRRSVITCKAVVCRGPDQWKVEEIEVDPPLASEVRIKMLFASVCHSDLLFSKGYPLPLYPRVLGHEGIGVVQSIGENVKELKEGDVVIPSPIGVCGECENCSSGETNMCLTYPISFAGLMPEGTSRLHLPAAASSGQDGGGERQLLYHAFSCSTWSEYLVSRANYLVKLDPAHDLPLPHASFLACGFSTGFGSVQVEARVRKGSSVVVFGLGGVGLGAVAGAKVQGAATIIGVDKNEMKREKGEAFGITHFINPDQYPDKPISELIRDLTGGHGVDCCIECTGAGHLINQALDSTKVGKGKVVLVSAGQTNGNLNFLSLLMGRTLKGTIYGGIKPRSFLPYLLDLCKREGIPLDKLLTHEIQLEDIAQVTELLKRQDCVKILIKI